MQEPFTTEGIKYVEAIEAVPFQDRTLNPTHNGHLLTQAGVLAQPKSSTVRCYACGFDLSAAVA